MGSNAPSAAGVIGRPSRLPTEKGCGPCAGCWACDARGAAPRISRAVGTRNVTRCMRAPCELVMGGVVTLPDGVPRADVPEEVPTPHNVRADGSVDDRREREREVTLGQGGCGIDVVPVQIVRAQVVHL